MKKILIIDDEKIVRDSFSKVLAAYGFSTLEAPDGKIGVSLFSSENPSAVLLDLKMPGENGIDILQQLKKIDHQIPIVIVTANNDIQTAVETIKLGAYDFISKPPEFDRLIVILQRAIENLSLKRKVEKLDSALDYSYEWMLGKSKPVQKVIKQIQQIAQSDFSVILQGETGTGKTYIAHIIHNLSKRADKSFVKIDIGAIPESLVESELFGYEKGAFTGANRKKGGFFESAHGGTIFIDELENMSAYVQTKLLTVIEEKKFIPIGSTKSVETNVRVISATNSNIKKSVADGRFREDLFYRFGEFIITIPPLRDRVEDISFFVHKFLLEANADLDKDIKEISDRATNILNQYSWPGNIRELKTVIKKAVLFADNVIREEHIDFLNKSSDKTPSTLTLKDAVRKVEIQVIKQALSVSKGNKSKAANMLQVNYKTFLAKLKEYNIDLSYLTAPNNVN